jgi:hypothetical protein
MASKKEDKNNKRKDPMSSEQIKSHETMESKRDSDTDIVEGGYWH